MQTFMPHANFAASAAVLDQKRLGKQRLECLQILRTLAGQSDGWKNHPAVLMWRGHEAALVTYTLAIISEWRDRGYRDSCIDRLPEFINLFAGNKGKGPPFWLNSPDFHRAHRSNLIRKNPEHYRRFWPHIPDDLPYIWPTT